MVPANPKNTGLGLRLSRELPAHTEATTDSARMRMMTLMVTETARPETEKEKITREVLLPRAGREISPREPKRLPTSSWPAATEVRTRQEEETRPLPRALLARETDKAPARDGAPASRTRPLANTSLAARALTSGETKAALPKSGTPMTQPRRTTAPTTPPESGTPTLTPPRSGRTITIPRTGAPLAPRTPSSKTTRRETAPRETAS